MARSTYVDKGSVVAVLRERGLSHRADWVERELPALIDAVKHASLLRTLGIDPADHPVRETAAIGPEGQGAG